VGPSATHSLLLQALELPDSIQNKYGLMSLMIFSVKSFIPHKALAAFPSLIPQIPQVWQRAWREIFWHFSEQMSWEVCESFFGSDLDRLVGIERKT